MDNVQLIRKAYSVNRCRDIELYLSTYHTRKGTQRQFYFIILKKIPTERMSADVRKSYRTEKQARKQFNNYVNF